MLDAGADVATVQKMMERADLSTTTRDDRRGEEAKKKAASLLHFTIMRLKVRTLRGPPGFSRGYPVTGSPFFIALARFCIAGFESGSGSEKRDCIRKLLTDASQHAFSHLGEGKGDGSSQEKEDQADKGNEEGPFERASTADLGRGFGKWGVEHERCVTKFFLGKGNGRFGTPFFEMIP